MLNYCVDSYMCGFFCLFLIFFFLISTLEKQASYANVDRNKGRNKGKRHIISLWTSLLFVSKTKGQLFVANLKPGIALVALSDVSWHLFCLPEELTLSHLSRSLSCFSSEASYIEQSITFSSGTKSAVFLTLKWKGPIDKILARTGDLEYLVLIPKWPKRYQNCLKFFIQK